MPIFFFFFFSPASEGIGIRFSRSPFLSLPPLNANTLSLHVAGEKMIPFFFFLLRVGDFFSLPLSLAFIHYQVFFFPSLDYTTFFPLSPARRSFRFRIRPALEGVPCPPPPKKYDFISSPSSLFFYEFLSPMKNRLVFPRNKKEISSSSLPRSPLPPFSFFTQMRPFSLDSFCPSFMRYIVWRPLVPPFFWDEMKFPSPPLSRHV